MDPLESARNGKSSSVGQVHPKVESDLERVASVLSGKVLHLLQATVVSPTKSNRSPLNKTDQDCSIGNLECTPSPLFGKVPNLSQATMVSPT
jgi:hypothetical protein